MTNKNKRIIHSPEFKAETLKLAEKVGLAAGSETALVTRISDLRLA